MIVALRLRSRRAAGPHPVDLPQGAVAGAVGCARCGRGCAEPAKGTTPADEGRTDDHRVRRGGTPGLLGRSAVVIDILSGCKFVIT